MPTPTITLTDLAGDPFVGFAASVSGSGGGPVAWRWQAVDGNAAWWETTSGGTGDGTTLVPTTLPGLWWVHAETTNGRTVPLRIRAGEGLPAVATRVRDDVAATIALLGLPEIGGRIYKQVRADATGLDFPCVVIDVAGLSEGGATGLDGLDYVVYPVKVALCDSGVSATDHDALPKWESWRQAVLRAFRTAHLPGVPECAFVRVEPNLIVDPELPEFQHFVSGIVLRVTCREPRGLGA